MSRRIALLAVVFAFVGLAALPANALTDRWATWAPLAGSANAYTTVLQQASPGFPAARVASDSRAPAQLVAGATVFLGPGTPPGAKYGSSAGNPYLLLRPRADTPASPSTTTYTFDAPTPDTGWAFVFGDIDADQVRVTATDAAGGAVPAAEVSSWFAGTFNYSASGTDLPSWNATTSTLVGNPGALDTDGASGWFEPDVRLTSLTLTFTRRAGFPVYQTWFVSRARPIGGTVTDVSTTGSCTPSQATMTLLSPYGEQLATATPAADGSYSFGDFATQGDYLVRLDVPDACAAVGPAQRTVDNRGNDNSPASRADFDVRAIVPQPVSGTVRDDSGTPVAGAQVTLTAPGGGTTTTTTGADGTYLFDDNATGEGYAISITVPTGFAAGPAGTTITVDVANAPITGQDFVVVDLPSVTGTVHGGGQGVGGVQVVLTPVGGGAPFTVATQGDGSYELDGLPPGDYTLQVTAPAGFTAPPPRTISVPTGGLTGQDVQLERPGALGGTTTRDGTPLADVEVVVDGPGGPRVLHTDADGQYFLDQLAPGTYVITVTAPAGSVVVGPATRTVVITAAGEVRGGQDFALTTAPPPTTSPSPSPTPSPTVTPTESPTATATATATETSTDEQSPTPDDGDDGNQDDTHDSTGTGVLPDTGGPSGGLAAGAVALVLAGFALIVTGRRRSRP